MSATNWAIIDDATNLVINVILWDGVSQWTKPPDSTVLETSAFAPEPGIGWLYDRANDVFLSPPLISSVTPTQGPISGGTSLILTGVNFVGATSVTLGEIPASFVLDSNTQITVTTPQAQRAGEYQIVVSTALQQGYPFIFTYTP